MAASGKRKPSSFAAAVLFPIILYCIPLSIFLLHPSSDLLRDETANVRAALLSRGNYSAMIPDLVSQLLHHYPVGAEEAITVFVPSEDTEYDWCETERPEVRVLCHALEKKRTLGKEESRIGRRMAAEIGKNRGERERKERERVKFYLLAYNPARWPECLYFDI
ncbi:unnamed protein product [Linum trigynum]|uniref:Uncharacterized protein n=1 Tax=Linum trigynum TaxID=586398 RepID=A0AAV2CQM3_9ROSI